MTEQERKLKWSQWDKIEVKRKILVRKKYFHSGGINKEEEKELQEIREAMDVIEGELICAQ